MVALVRIKLDIITDRSWWALNTPTYVQIRRGLNRGKLKEVVWDSNSDANEHKRSEVLDINEEIERVLTVCVVEEA